jgi:hypothetical protein
LVYAPTFEGWYLLQGPAVAISCTTAIYALLFSGVSRREGGRAEIGVARIECSSIQTKKKCEKYGDDSKRPLVTFHGPAPLGRNYGELGVTSQFFIEVQPLFIRNSF